MRILITGAPEQRFGAGVLTSIVGPDAVRCDHTSRPSPLAGDLEGVSTVLHSCPPLAAGDAEWTAEASERLVANTRRVLDASESAGVRRLVLLSSLQVYGCGIEVPAGHLDPGPLTPKYLPVDEVHPTVLHFDGLGDGGEAGYAKALAHAEQLCKERCEELEVVILRVGFSDLDGIHGSAEPNSVNQLIEIGGACSMRSLSSAIEAAMGTDSRFTRIYNVCDGRQGLRQGIQRSFGRDEDQMFSSARMTCLSDTVGSPVRRWVRNAAKRLRRRGSEPKVNYNPMLHSPAYADRHAGEDFLVLGSGPSLKTYRNEITEFIRKNDPVVMGSNTIGEFIAPDYHAFTSRHRIIEYGTTINHEASRALVSPYVPERIIQKYCPGPYEHLMYVDDNEARFNIVDGVVTSSCKSSAIILIGVALVMGARRIFAAGIDGFQSLIEQGVDLHYNPDQTTTKYAAGEKREYLRHYRTLQHYSERALREIRDHMIEKGLQPFTILTPTDYACHHGSIDGFVQRPTDLHSTVTPGALSRHPESTNPQSECT